LRPPFFPRGVSPVEAVLGDSCILARRMERSTVFPEWKSSVRLFMKISGSRIAYPDFGSRLVLPLPGLMKNILRLFRFRRACEGLDYSLLIPSQSRVLCRGEQLLLTFFGEGSRQLKLNRASLAKKGAESAGRRFLTSCSSACRSTRKLRDLKSPAQIIDQGSFCASQD